MVDELGFDPDYLRRALPFLRFLYRRYWRVTNHGIRRIPSRGRALLVSNHSGTIAIDALMLKVALLDEHPAHRVGMVLYDDFLPKTPFVGDFYTKTGGILACWENGVRLLEMGHWVIVCPEGTRGVGKLYRDRYRLVPFGNGGFVRLALETRTPIVPISIVGPEEIYPILYKSERLGRMLNFPYVPVTATFPLLGLLGLVPFPSKWSIWYDEPIRPWEHVGEYETKEALVKDLTERVRSVIQGRLERVVASRKSVVFG